MDTNGYIWRILAGEVLTPYCPPRSQFWGHFADHESGEELGRLLYAWQHSTSPTWS